MRKQSARGQLMTMRRQKSPNRQLRSNPNSGWGLQRRESRNSNQTVPLTGADKDPRIRVILHPHHPWNNEATGVGKVVVLPKTMEEILKVANEKFNNHPTKVLSKEAAEIDDIRVIRENDHLYMIDEDKFVSAPQGIDTDDFPKLQAVVTALSQSKSQSAPVGDGNDRG